MLKLRNASQKTVFSLVKCYRLLFALAEPMPGVTHPLLKWVREKDRERKKEQKNTDVTVSVALIMQCGWIGGGVVVVGTA